MRAIRISEEVWQAIRAILDKAPEFASEQGASVGQLNAVRKTLTDGGYHLTK